MPPSLKKHVHKITQRYDSVENKIEPNTKIWSPFSSLIKRLKLTPQKIAVITATPAITAIECATTYPAVASVGLMQSCGINFFTALKQQSKQPHGLYQGGASFGKSKLNTRFMNLALPYVINGNNPSLFKIIESAILSGTLETILTNKLIVKSRLQVLAKTKSIMSRQLSVCSRAVFPLHAIKNSGTILAAQSAYNLTPREFLDNIPCGENTARGIVTGACIMLLQIVWASKVDTAMTLLMWDIYKKPNSSVNLWKTIYHVMSQSRPNDLKIATARATIFGFSYSLTFIMLGIIKDMANRNYSGEATSTVEKMQQQP